MRSMAFALILCTQSFMLACAGGGGSGLTGNTGGSEPVNPSEENEYKRAILKCHKTGGSRVVKIEGQLKCY